MVKHSFLCLRAIHSELSQQSNAVGRSKKDWQTVYEGQVSSREKLTELFIFKSGLALLSRAVLPW